jgi:Zn-dependent oligopeptidase
VEFHKSELDGVPPETIQLLAEKNPVPGKKGFVKISLDKNKAGAYLASFTNENSRKKMKEAMDNVNRNNLPILDKLMDKRHLSALMLNYTNFA